MGGMEETQKVVQGNQSGMILGLVDVGDCEVLKSS